MFNEIRNKSLIYVEEYFAGKRSVGGINHKIIEMCCHSKISKLYISHNAPP